MFHELPKDQCNGCMACINVCPKNIISVKKDKLGFAYPFLNEPEKCINCNRCNDVCPSRKKHKITTNVGEVICGYNRNQEDRYSSSSGGIFPLLCRTILSSSGVCYGVSFNENFETHHIRIFSESDIRLISSSKYVEAGREYIFRSVEEDLKTGIIVLFSGTPCQAYGLKAFLRKDYSNLICVDLLCYGIPSPIVWNKWLEYISNGRRPVYVDFRDKTIGWNNYSLRIDFEDGSSYCKPKAEDYYIATFSKGAYIRRSCYACKLKAFPRASDITLGDFQELKELSPDADPKNGWSMIRINTDKGKELFNQVKEYIVFNIVDADIMNSIHPGIGASSPKHPNREKVEALIDNVDIKKILAKYASLTPEMKIRQKTADIKRNIKHMLKRFGIIKVD